jgi:hypothetical protein
MQQFLKVRTNNENETQCANQVQAQNTQSK